MLDIFGKKKNKKAEQKKENAVDTAMEQSKQRSQTLEALSDNRNTHEQIEAAFSELLRDPGIAQASFKAACANEQKLEKLRAAAEEMDASDAPSRDWHAASSKRRSPRQSAWERTSWTALCSILFPISATPWKRAAR